MILFISKYCFLVIKYLKYCNTIKELTLQEYKDLK